MTPICFVEYCFTDLAMHIGLAEDFKGKNCKNDLQIQKPAKPFFLDVIHCMEEYGRTANFAPFLEERRVCAIIYCIIGLFMAHFGNGLA